MSKVKISSNQYIGAVEMNRLQDFLTEGASKTILRMIIKKFGVDPNVKFQDFGPLFVGFAGDGFLYLSPGEAVDSDFNIIKNRSRHEFAVPATGPANGFRFVLISYDTTSKEVGTVSVATDGSMVGSNTSFKETLRGAPGEPLYVRFPNSSLNMGEYPIAEVISNDHAIINALNLYPESNLEYEVLGAFPSDGFVATENRKIFLHDSFKLEIVPFLPSDTNKRIPIVRLSYDADGNFLGWRDLRPEYKLTI